jgi:hypothetical protein
MPNCTISIDFSFFIIIIMVDPALEEFEKIAPEAVAELQQLKDAKSVAFCC